MKPIYLLLLLLSISNSFGQDIILLKNNEIIRAKVIKIMNDTVEFNRLDNMGGPIYEIPTSLIEKIDFETDTVQYFQLEEVKNLAESPNYTLVETKEFIVKTINDHGFDEDSFKRRYRASFEGDLLRLIIMRKNENEPSHKGILYDFSNVYKFQRVSKRSNQLAYVNIFVSIVKNERKMKFDKHKLIMRVDDPEKAQSILNALKHYNSLLLGKNKSGDKF